MRDIKILLPNLNQSLWGLISHFIEYSNTFRLPVRLHFDESYINSRFGGASSFAVLAVNGREYLVDVQDNPRPYEFYKDYELVFKRSFSSKITYPGNVIPYGFRLDQTVPIYEVCRRSNLLTLANLNNRNWKEIRRSTFLNKLLPNDLFDNKLRNIRAFYDTNIADYNGRIAYSARYWREEGREDRIKINSQRTSIYNFLSVSGLNCFCSLKFISQKTWIKILQGANIVVVNNGLHDVPGLRIAEATVFSKCPVSPELNVLIPEYIEGKNYIRIQDDISDLASVLEYLVKSKDYTEIQYNNSIYSSEFLLGSKKAEYILNEIKRRS